MAKNKGKYLISLRTYFSIGSIITLCLSCLLSSALVLIPTVFLYHGEISLSFMIFVCLAICSLSMIIGGIALYIGSAHFVRPLEDMGKVVRKISKGDFSARVNRETKKGMQSEYMHEKFLKDNAGKIGDLVNLSTAALIESTYGQMQNLTRDAGIKLSDKEFHCRGSFTALHAGHPDAADMAAACKFVKGFCE
ncbi:hypothetical protein QYZ88_013000 [Lachnospiraceae bacterium C1.1]|nr:hypothetical protein [Lachnospiraceae bacterium C1.1]